MKLRSGMIISFSMILLLTSSCSEDSEPTKPINHAPVIESISASPSSLKINEKTTIACIATDQDGDDLTYTWSSEQGSFPGETIGSTVQTLLKTYIENSKYF